MSIKSRIARLEAEAGRPDDIHNLSDAALEARVIPLIRELAENPETPTDEKAVYLDAIRAHEQGQPIPDAALVAAINA